MAVNASATSDVAHVAPVAHLAQSSSLGSRVPSSTPCAHPARVARRAWAQGAGSLLLMAAALFGAAGLGIACSQPRAEGPKSASDAPKIDAPPAAAANSPATAQPAAAATATGLLAAGTQAPDVEGKDAKGQAQHLSDRRGHVSIVYFYPKDGTPGCTKEACAFRDTFDKFNQRGVTIFGVSRDDEASHAKFRTEHSLPFPLVSDPSGAVQKAYGVPDRVPGLASRVTFLVAADGRIAKVWPDVDPAVHADEVFQAIEQLN
jgi:thioredoxin-dependent peroxiredoxin